MTVSDLPRPADSETSFRELVDLLPESIFEADLSLRVTFANRTAVETYRIPPRVILGMRLDATITRSDRRGGTALLRKVLQGETFRGVEFLALRRDGTTFPAIANVTPIVRDGMVCGVRGILIDISERKRAEERLRESEQRFRSVFDHAPLGLFHFDARGRLLDCNERFATIIGTARDDLRGFDMLRQVRDVGVRRAFSDALDGRNGYFEGEYRSVTSGKATPVRVLFSPVHDDRGHVVGGVALVEDISEWKRAQSELRRLEEQFLQAQKMEAVGRLAGGVAHDFNNLLTAISGFADLALMAPAGSEMVRHRLGEIKAASRRAAELTQQLLAFSRRQIIRPHVISANGLLLNVQSMVRRLVGENIQLSIRLGARRDAVRVDPNQIEQVLLNLVVNARDAMPIGGRLTLETDRILVNEEMARRSPDGAVGEYVVIRVGDTGAGMTPEVRDHLFEPFFTTKPKGEGTGLGLATAYGIVRQSGGFFTVESAVDCGSLFAIHLPAAPDEATVEQLPAEPAPGESPRGSETILLVEDEPMVREVASFVLRQHGYTVFEAGTGQEARRIEASHTDITIDLLLTDVVLPDMTGREVAKRLREAREGLRVLFTSGYTEQGIVQEGQELEQGIDFLPKPFLAAELLARVRAVLDRPKVPPSPEVP